MFFEHRIVEEKLRRSCTNIVVIGQIYFLDVQVWYTVISALLGGLEGAKDRLGEVGPQSKPIHSMISYKLKQNLIILHWQTCIIDSDSNFVIHKVSVLFRREFLLALPWNQRRIKSDHEVHAVYILAIASCVWHFVSTFCGFCGQIRDLSMLRKRFIDYPQALVQRLQPMNSSRLVLQTPLLVSSSLHIFQAWRAVQFYSSISYDANTVLRMKAIVVNTTLPVAYSNTRMVFTGIVPWENVTCAAKHNPLRNTTCRPVFPFIYVGKHSCDVSMSYSWLMPMPLNLSSIWSWENISPSLKDVTCVMQG